MSQNTFPCGIHPADHKSPSASVVIETMPAPQVVYIPVAQHIGRPATVCVEVGDTVRMGQMIAAADGMVSANVFASVSGTVKQIVDRPTATGGMAKHIVIQNDGLDTPEALPRLADPTRDQIIERIRQAGIVGMGGAGFPTHVKLAPTKPVDTFIINAAECEPYITCDYRIMLDYTQQFVRGSLLLAGALGLDAVTIAIEDNKPDAIEHLRTYCQRAGLAKVTITAVHTKYPQGAEKQLIFAVTRRTVPAGGLPMDVGCVVNNVSTALATYLAINDGQTMHQRVVTVSGRGISRPVNMWVRIGTLYSDIIDYLGGASEDTVRLVSGGPMMGAAVPDADYAITKTSGSILLLTAEECFVGQSSACINCAKCAGVCPMNLMPMYIDSFALHNQPAGAVRYGALNCIECGCCAYICPAKRPLVQSIRHAKKLAREANIK